MVYQTGKESNMTSIPLYYGWQGVAVRLRDSKKESKVCRPGQENYFLANAGWGGEADNAGLGCKVLKRRLQQYCTRDD